MSITHNSTRPAVVCYMHLFFEKLPHDGDGSFQVGLVERISDVPSQGPELPPFLLDKTK